VECRDRVSIRDPDNRLRREMEDSTNLILAEDTFECCLIGDIALANGNMLDDVLSV
jgi:hypothetical protein